MLLVVTKNMDIDNIIALDEIQARGRNTFFLALKNEAMTYEEVKSNVLILHFTGQAKPWIVDFVRYHIEKSGGSMRKRRHFTMNYWNRFLIIGWRVLLPKENLRSWQCKMKN